MYDVGILSNFYSLPNGQIVKDVYKVTMLLEASDTIVAKDRGNKYLNYHHVSHEGLDKVFS